MQSFVYHRNNFSREAQLHTLRATFGRTTSTMYISRPLQTPSEEGTTGKNTQKTYNNKVQYTTGSSDGLHLLKVLSSDRLYTQ